MRWKSDQREFTRSELVRFVQAVDRNLASPTSIVIVGGSAAMLGYDARVRTSDIDLFESDSDAGIFEEASELAREETGLPVDVEKAVVTDIPDGYLDRAREVDLRLEHLSVIVPDEYDLVLSKTVRSWDHDVGAIVEIHRNSPLDLNVLVERFEKELLPIAVTDKKKLCLNLAMVVARLFGMDAGRDAAVRWGVPIPTALLPTASSKGEMRRRSRKK